MKRMLFCATVAILITTNVLSQPATRTAYAEPASNRLSVVQLDAESQRCMVCHDGSRALRIELRPAGAPMEFENGDRFRTKNHAVGMEYEVAYNAKPNEFVQPAMLEKSIKIFSGKVGCLSCHAKREILLADGGQADRRLTETCTVDRAAEGYGPNCLKCHIK
jgi:hypothetical protein